MQAEMSWLLLSHCNDYWLIAMRWGLPGVRLYHTATALPGGGVVVFGGRSSPLNPIRGLMRVTQDALGPPGTRKLCVEPMVCTGDPPAPRWRHTATSVSHQGGRKQEASLFFISYHKANLFPIFFFFAGKSFLFVFGGKNESEAALGDGGFLSVDQQHWTEVCPIL